MLPESQIHHTGYWNHVTGITNVTRSTHVDRITHKHLFVFTVFDSHLRLHRFFGLAVFVQPLDVDLTIKVANVTDDRVLEHSREMVCPDDIFTSRRRYEDTCPTDGIFNCRYFVSWGVSNTFLKLRIHIQNQISRTFMEQDCKISHTYEQFKNSHKSVSDSNLCNTIQSSCWEAAVHTLD